jgi:hypothetical protein
MNATFAMPNLHDFPVPSGLEQSVAGAKHQKGKNDFLRRSIFYPFSSFAFRSSQNGEMKSHQGPLF